MIFTFGSALGPVISGFIADYLSYTLVWIIYFILTVIYFTCLLISLKSKKPSELTLRFLLLNEFFNTRNNCLFS